jgi:hypothetical protein
MKQLVSILMESPLYFQISVEERLRLLKYLADKYLETLEINYERR